MVSKEIYKMYIAPHGRTIRLDLPHLADGVPHVTLTKKTQQQFLKDLKHLTDHYFQLDERALRDTPLRTVQFDYGKPVGGIRVEKGEHGCVTVFGGVAEPHEKGRQQLPVFLGLSEAHGLCHFMRAIIQNKPVVRKRIREATAPCAEAPRKRTRKAPPVRKRKRA